MGWCRDRGVQAQSQVWVCTGGGRKGLACKPYLESGTPVLRGPIVSPTPYCFDQGEIGRVLTTVSFLSMLEMMFASQSEDYRK